MVRAKFQVQGIKQVSWNQEGREVTLSAVSADGIPENERYHKYTPSGELKIFIDNPAALAQFEMGKFYYIDFTPAT